MSITIMKRISFAAGHRLLNHGGKCENLHGHNYVAEIFVTGQQTDEVGRVVDFSVIKKLFKTWIDDHWDHSMILWEEDQKAIDAISQVEPHRIHVMPWNPTAENMAKYLLCEVAPGLLKQIGDYDVKVSKVVMWETETSSATVTADVPDDQTPRDSDSWQQSLTS